MSGEDLSAAGVIEWYSELGRLVAEAHGSDHPADSFRLYGSVGAGQFRYSRTILSFIRSAVESALEYKREEDLIAELEKAQARVAELKAALDGQHKPFDGAEANTVELEKPSPGTWLQSVYWSRSWGASLAAQALDFGGKWQWWAYHPGFEKGCIITRGTAPTREWAMHDADKALLAEGYPVPDAAPGPGPVVYDVGPWKPEPSLGLLALVRFHPVGFNVARVWLKDNHATVWNKHGEFVDLGRWSTAKLARRACDNHLRGRGLTLDPRGEA